MTNLKKIFSIVGIVVVAGCGSSGGGGGGGGGTNHIIAGDWKSATIAKDGSAAVNCPGTLTVGGVVINECGVNDTILLRADLSFQEVNAGGSNAGTYAVSGNTITLTMTIKHGIALTPAEVTSAHFSITGNVLTIRPLLSGTTTENGETQTFTITNVVGATLVWKPGIPSTGFERARRITFPIRDLLGTAGAVVDLDSGEMLELA
ncbi:MAG: hypothetical protein ABJA67_05025, partial [Chthonomonadales bacterium]